MKTIKELKSQITDIINQVSTGAIKEKAAIREVSRLRQNIAFLETNPSEAFLKSEIERLENIIKDKSSQFNQWFQGASQLDRNRPRPSAYYYKIMGIDVMKKQVENIKLLL
jgi:ribosomal protein L29